MANPKSSGLAFGGPKADPAPTPPVSVPPLTFGSGAAGVTQSEGGGGTGSDGAAGTITIDSVTTLPAGSPATVVNEGTASAARLALGIPQGPAGPPGVNAAGLSGLTAKTYIAPGASHAAFGDGVHDDTAALQALIDNTPPGQTIYIEPGKYNISSPLLLARNGTANYTGQTIVGLGHWSPQPYASSGVSIQMTATGQEAFFLIGTGQGRDIQISNITLFGLVGSTPTANGIKTRGTNFSRMTLGHIVINGVLTGLYKSNPDGGANGEFITATQCSFGDYAYTTCNYKNDTAGGQGVDDQFYGCFWGGANGCTCLDIGPTISPGANAATCSVFGMRGTFAPGPLANAIVHSRGAAMINIVGAGRMEHCNQLASLDRAFGKVNIQGLFTTANTGDTGAIPFIVGDGTNNYASLSCQGCVFAGNGSPIAVSVGTGNPNFTAAFTDCDWANYGSDALTALVTPTATTVKTKFRNCRYAPTGTNAKTDIADR